MGKKYVYNTDTGKLHIVGYCQGSKNPPYHAKYFDTEDEALAYDGRAVSMCKRCMRKREQESKQKNQKTQEQKKL